MFKIKKFIKSHPKPATVFFVAITLLGVCFLYFNKPGESKFLLPCIFHKATTLYCAGCGTTRALYYLLHADIKTAIRCNALTVIILPFVIYGFISYVLNTYSGKLLLPPIKITKNVTVLILIIVICFVVLRNIPVFPFCVLAPINIL